MAQYSGMRAGEVCALTWRNVDFAGKTISINKTAIEEREKDSSGHAHSALKTQNNTKTKSGTRIIPMTQKAYDALCELQKITGTCEHITTSSNGVRIRPSRLDTTFHKILDAIHLQTYQNVFLCKFPNLLRQFPQKPSRSEPRIRFTSFMRSTRYIRTFSRLDLGL